MRQGLFILLCSLSVSYAISQAGIGITVPHASAMLDVTSTNKGFLPPRMTTAERNTITSPAAGLTIYNTTVNCLQWWNGTGWYDACDHTLTGPPIVGGACAGEPEFFTFLGKEYRPVVSSGKCWLDRNLGATAVTGTARSAYGDDAAYIAAESASFGDLYQWGRGADGHQVRSPLSGTTSTLSSTDTPGNGNFILTSVEPFDWRSDNNNNRWNASPIVNNPCPSGYRVPIEVELNAELLSWTSQNAAGAFASPLKLPLSGIRGLFDGSLFDVGTSVDYWSSTVTGTTSFDGTRSLSFDSSLAGMVSSSTAFGFSVRCIKD